MTWYTAPSPANNLLLHSLNLLPSSIGMHSPFQRSALAGEDIPDCNFYRDTIMAWEEDDWWTVCRYRFLGTNAYKRQDRSDLCDFFVLEGPSGISSHKFSHLLPPW